MRHGLAVLRIEPVRVFFPRSLPEDVLERLWLKITDASRHESA